MAQGADESSGGKPRGLPFKVRFRAWWEGYDLSGRDHHDVDEPTAPVDADSAGHDALRPMRRGADGPLWSPARIQVVEAIWGKGFTSPGGSDYVPELLKPLGLNPAMSVLDLAAGLGGIAQIMAKTYGCWVTGLEADAVLAAEGMQRSTLAGMAKHCPIAFYDPEAFAHDKRVDAVLAKEFLFSVRNKDRLLDGIVKALKPKGQFLFTDYVAETPAALQALRGWCEREPRPPELWTVPLVESACVRRRLDLRIAEDVTDRHRAMILRAVQALTGRLASLSLDLPTRAAVLDEVELWAGRVAALDAGLRVYRFFAIKPA